MREDYARSLAFQQVVWLLGPGAVPLRLHPEILGRKFHPAALADPAALRKDIEHMRSLVGHDYSIEHVVSVDDHDVELVIAGEDDRRWTLVCGVEPRAPHRISTLGIRPSPPSGTVIRDAGSEDAAALAELERRCPVELGNALVTYDRGDDYFAPARLVQDATVLAVLVEGVHAGVYWGIRQSVRIGGASRTLLLEHHVRVDPQVQDESVLWSLVTEARDRLEPSADAVAYLIARRNQRARRYVPDVAPWTAQAVRVLLPCAELAGPDAGRRPDLHDAGRIVQILNTCHDDAELFVPYTSQSLEARLDRDPPQYGWDRIRLAEGACIGVGRGVLHVSVRRGDDVLESRWATALDHGLMPGAGDAYTALVRAWCAELAGEGFSHLAMVTSPGLPTWPLLAGLAEDVERFDLWTLGLGEPDGATRRGLYVDPVWL